MVRTQKDPHVDLAERGEENALLNFPDFSPKQKEQTAKQGKAKKTYLSGRKRSPLKPSSLLLQKKKWTGCKTSREQTGDALAKEENKEHECRGKRYLDKGEKHLWDYWDIGPLKDETQKDYRMLPTSQH